MKDNDKVTLTYGQLKKLVKESYGPNNVIDNIFDQMNILDDLRGFVEDAIEDAQNIVHGGRNQSEQEDMDAYAKYESCIQRILQYVEQIKQFDVIAL